MPATMRAMAEAHAPPPSERPNWSRRVVIGLVVVAGGFLAYVIGAAVIPRWWAQRIGNFVDGRLTVGGALGAALGFVFTVLPLLVLWAALRWRGGWRRWLGFVLAAVLVAAPNLMTLGVVAGRGNAAHAGERILDVYGPGFRAGTLVGVVVGLVLFGVLAYLVTSRRASRRRASRLQDELRGGDAEREAPA